MQWTDIQKDWKTLKSRFQTKWNKLTDADLTAIAGKKDELLTRLQKHYKLDKAKLEQEVSDFVKALKAPVAR